MIYYTLLIAPCGFELIQHSLRPADRCHWHLWHGTASRVDMVAFWDGNWWKTKAMTCNGRQCPLTIDTIDIWWYLMIFDDIWWYLMICWWLFDDIWWYVGIYPLKHQERSVWYSMILSVQVWQEKLGLLREFIRMHRHRSCIRRWVVCLG